MKMLGQVDSRYISYNIEAVEVTGGRFWAPFKSTPQSQPETPVTFGSTGPGAMDARFQYRSPIDLSNKRLRKIATALGPAYVRVSGTWRNSTYFQDNDEPALKTPPPGFQNVLTRAEWKGVIDFASATNGALVASVTTSAGVRDADGVWTSGQAKAWFDYTKSIGGNFAAMEFMNEPTLMNLGGVSESYGPSEYGRDSRIFKTFLQKESPQTLYLGPSSTAEGLPQAPPPHMISSERLLQATGPIFDGFSYHVYYTRSHRCSGSNGMDVSKVLAPEWFERGLAVEKFYSDLSDKYLPGKALWLTETGEASCGGDQWAAQFIDSFRLLDQYGSLAQKSVQSIMYNTLASSDYGLVDEETLEPRPNYWATLLWKRTMGTRALDPGIAPAPGLRVYAQCLNHSKGGVALLVLNVDQKDAASLRLPMAGTRYTLSSPDLHGKTVLFNGSELKLGKDDSVPEYKGETIKAGVVSFAPATITVIAMPTADNSACQVE